MVFKKNQMRTDGANCPQPLRRDLILTISKKNTDLVKKNAIGVSFMKKKWWIRLHHAALDKEETVALLQECAELRVN